jgi:hypothetical protein
MTQLLRLLVQIALLRRSPGELPASTVLLLLAAVAYGALRAVRYWMRYGDDQLWARAATDLGLMIALAWLVLAVTRLLGRFRQTLTAMLGAAVVIAPLGIALLVLQEQSSLADALRWLAWAGSVALIIWYTLIVGHILKSALEVGLVTSVAIALTWLLAGDALIRRIFPAVA